jgi:KDO2-lipid IV(A) lauroyltransferase
MYLISDGLYFFIYYIVKYRKKTVFINLHTSFPEKSKEEITRIAKSFYRHFSDFLVEIAKCISMSPKELDKRMKFKNTELFAELAVQKRNFAIVSAHYNNWELTINLPQKMEHRCMIIYRPLKSKVMDRLSLYIRGRLNTSMTPMENIFREGVKNRSENKLFCIWFLADQRPPRNSKFWTRFLNHDAAFFVGAEKISKKLDMAVIFMDIQKVRRGHYEVTFEKLFENAAITKENEITLAGVKKMEEVIIRRPDFWLWSHKRFKHSKPKNVNLITS